jgi:hypothetical protein
MMALNLIFDHRLYMRARAMRARAMRVLLGLARDAGDGVDVAMSR